MQSQCVSSSASLPSSFLQKFGKSQPDLTEGQWFQSYYFPILFIKMNRWLEETLSVNLLREDQLCELNSY